MSRIRADQLVNRVGSGGPKFPNGVADGFSVSGIVTATSFSGSLTGAIIGNVTGNADTATSATTATTASALGSGATGSDLTLSGNLTVNGTTTTIDTAVTSVDSLAVDGNVGIGTTNATSILDVRNGTIVKDQDTTQNAANPGLQLKHNGTINGSWRHDGRLEIGGQDADAEITLNSNGSVEFAGTIWGGTTDGGVTATTSYASRLYNNSAFPSIWAKNSGNGGLWEGVNSSGTRTSKIDSDGSAEFGGSVSINGGEGLSAVFYLAADQGDDNGDTWRIISNQDDNDLTFSNNVSGSYADKVTFLNNGNATFAGTVTDSNGNLRTTPISAKTGNYTLLATDTGKTITRTGGDITVPQSMPVGMVVTIINDHSSTMSIIKGTGVTLRSTDGSDATKTLAAYGVATVLYISASSAYLTGSGLS